MNRLTHRRDPGLPMQVLDSEHRELSALLVELNYQVANGSPQDLQVRLMEELRGLSLKHFAFEESVMHASNYPGLDGHRSRHRAMLEQTQRFAAYWSSRKSVSVIDPAGLLWEEHVLHMEGEDMGFDRWLNREGRL